jgi:flagellar basal-body rod modification protein FlgD
MPSAAGIGNQYVSSAYQPNSANQPSSSMDKNGFLKMLTAQMSNQDPTSGQDPNQYFQTISMMTEVEQMTNVATAQTASLSRQRDSNATDLLGKTVTYTGAAGTASGNVDSVQLSATNGPTLTIGGVSGIDPDSVTNITTTTPPSA